MAEEKKIPKVAIDAGHGLKTAGKETPDKIKEWTLNDAVRDNVVAILSNYEVEFIFPDNDEGNTDEALKARRTMYLEAEVDAAVSIHHNAYQSKWGTHTGVGVFIDKNYTEADMTLAKAIEWRLAEYTGLRNRGTKFENFSVINQNKIPAVLVEGGFMDSTIDYPVITSTKGQDAYARAVAEGLIEFLKLEKKPGVEEVVIKQEEKVKMKSIKKGLEHADVEVFQAMMKRLGFYTGEIDGKAGGKSVAAIEAFQTKYPECGTDGKPDGSFGRKCWTKLFSLFE